MTRAPTDLKKKTYMPFFQFAIIHLRHGGQSKKYWNQVTDIIVQKISSAIGRSRNFNSLIRVI